MSIIKYSGRLNLALCQEHPEKYFVFGDNLVGKGTAGQACIRFASNSLGVPTKVRPSMDSGSFMSDECVEHIDAVEKSLDCLWGMLKRKEVIVLPCDANGQCTLGTGLARMQNHAPILYKWMHNDIRCMIRTFGVDAVFDSVN